MIHILSKYPRPFQPCSNKLDKIVGQNQFGNEGIPVSETSVPSIFAAGHILHHEGKLHLIAGAFQDAANAVNKAKLYVAPEANTHGMVSSHNDLFTQKNRELMKHLYTK